MNMFGNSMEACQLVERAHMKPEGEAIATTVIFVLEFLKEILEPGQSIDALTHADVIEMIKEQANRKVEFDPSWKIKAGIQKRRAKTGKWGRPKKIEQARPAVLEAYRLGKSRQEIAEITGLSGTSVYRILRTLRPKAEKAA